MHIVRLLLLGLFYLGMLGVANSQIVDENTPKPMILVPRTADFSFTGMGISPEWSQADWVYLRKEAKNQSDYQTRIKLLYSNKGLYLLMEASDKKITASIKKDFGNLWTQDVFEVFIHPSKDYPVYFEYLLSPLGYELPLLVPNMNSKAKGWAPWPYDKNTKIKKKTLVLGGLLIPNSTISGWKAEIFIPFKLLESFQNVPPQKGTRWYGNFYRKDYDDGAPKKWMWSPVNDFHDFRNFGEILFK